MAYLNGKKIALNPKFNGVVNFKPLYDVLGLEPTIEGDTANIEDLTALVEGINALGIANLKKKLSEVADELTTVEIMSLIDSIIEIPSNLDHTVTFTVDGEPYEVVSVKDGNSVNAPTKPEKENYKFTNWFNDENTQVVFPLTPLNDMDLTANFEYSYADRLYTHYGIDKSVCPYVFIEIQTASKECRVVFAGSYSSASNSLGAKAPMYIGESSGWDVGTLDYNDAGVGVAKAIEVVSSVSSQAGSVGFSISSTKNHIYTNAPITIAYTTNIHQI